MRDLKKEMKHALKTAVLLATILVTTAVAVGTAYADDNSTLGVTTAIVAIKSDNQVVRRPDVDIFFNQRIVDPFFRPNIFFNPFIRFNPFFGIGVEDDAFGFGFGINEAD